MLARETFKILQTIKFREGLRLYRAYRLGWQNIISGYFTTCVLQVLFNVGLFDELLKNDSVHIATFTKKRGLDGAILQSLCDSLYALKLLDKDHDNYILSPSGELVATTGSGWFIGTSGYASLFHNLEAMLRKEMTFGNEVQRELSRVVKGTGKISEWIYFPIVTNTLTRLACQRVLDLGCGDGAFLQHLCQNSALSGYGVDKSSAMIEDADSSIRRIGIEERVQLFAADIFELKKIQPAMQDVDAVTIFFLLHEILFQGVEQVIKLLTDLRTLFPNVPVIIFEVNRPTPEEIRKRPGMSAQYIVQHVLSNQRLESSALWKKIFQEAGFYKIEEQHLNLTKTSLFILHG